MRKLLVAAALAAGGVLGSAEIASAQQRHLGPHATSVTWPCVTPPGWYTNTYNFAWHYPWFAYYDYSQGPYSNWVAGGGYTFYTHCGPGGHYYPHKEPTQPYFGAWSQGQGGPSSFQTLQGLHMAAPTQPAAKNEKPKDEKK